MVRDGDRHPNDAHVGAAAAVFARLTVQQRLVSVWMTAGFSDEEIARHLGSSEQEVRADFEKVARVLRNAG
ncbi:MAG: hypothetical protein AB7I50_08350 [Vicinamibacterales bacterium]